MFRTLRANGPALLVPLAWAFVTAAHVELVTTRTLLVAHVVMAVLLLAFAALSWSEMTDGALLAWRRVIVVGFLVTLAGTVGLATSTPVVPLLWVAVVGWMVLPAAGLLYTGRLVTTFPRVYLVGGACSALGAVAYLLAPVVVGIPLTLAGLALVGVGQTAGILAAVTD